MIIRMVYIFLFLLSFSGKPEIKKPVDALKLPFNFIENSSKKESAGSIPWLSHRKLAWDDFLSPPEKNSDAVASTSTSLGISYKVQNSEWAYSITCNFSKYKSWGLLRTDYILAHEQAHFDITEIFARKLHYELETYQFNRRTFKKDINAIYQKIVKEKEIFQKLYDGETDHSRNKKKQQLWLKKIEEILQKTEPYSDYP